MKLGNELLPVYVNGRRCLILPGKKTNHVPLVLLGGTAQTIDSWNHHLMYLSADRDVMVYECLGQGPFPPDMSQNPKEYFKEASNVELQVLNLSNVLESVFPSYDQVDVAGFSLGGRIALAAAASLRIRKLHLTGVPARRSAFGRLVLDSWKEMLHRDPSLKSFAWSTLLTTCSADFVADNESRIPAWVDQTARANTQEGLLALCETQSDSNHKWDILEIAKGLTIHPSNVRLAVGSNDPLAPVEQVQHLAQKLGKGAQVVVTIHDGAGHAVPLEKPAAWRSDLLNFLIS